MNKIEFIEYLQRLNYRVMEAAYVYNPYLSDELKSQLDEIENFYDEKNDISLKVAKCGADKVKVSLEYLNERARICFVSEKDYKQILNVLKSFKFYKIYCANGADCKIYILPFADATKIKDAYLYAKEKLEEYPHYDNAYQISKISQQGLTIETYEYEDTPYWSYVYYAYCKFQEIIGTLKGKIQVGEKYCFSIKRDTREIEEGVKALGLSGYYGRIFGEYIPLVGLNEKDIEASFKRLIQAPTEKSQKLLDDLDRILYEVELTSENKIMALRIDYDFKTPHKVPVALVWTLFEDCDYQEGQEIVCENLENICLVEENVVFIKRFLENEMLDEEPNVDLKVFCTELDLGDLTSCPSYKTVL